MRKALVCLFLFVSSASADSIDTFPYWNGDEFAYNLGEFRNRSFGQTFTAPQDETTLKDFTLQAYVFPDANPSKFAGYLMGWDGQKATGPVLYASDGLSLESKKGGFEKLKFHVDLDLVPGGQYVFFLNTSFFNDGLDDDIGLAFVFPYVFNYSGGGFVATDPSDFCSSTDFDCINFVVNWTYVGQSDLAFEAKFAKQVPEPATWVLIVLGMSVLSLSRLRETYPLNR